MKNLINVVKNVLSAKNENNIYIDEISDETNLLELQEDGYIQITHYERPAMGDQQGYMTIVKGPNFKEL
ncbi:hypothetical protein [Staphylococcus equorum]|uniref:Uncharacterized protein n=1 Tax=Staphylococcus equorum TaxID=246432 RepID=A0A9X4R2J9_9STAP|nr:hypothetical protein [Staphylococcus equorum]MDG0860310.1 hypothetical protein [Staphylococcus equorum]